MNDLISSMNLSMVMAHAPIYASLLVSIPLLGLVTIKLSLASRSAVQKQTPTSWVVLDERDAEGLPLLARATADSPQACMQRAYEVHAQRRQF